MKEKFEFVPDDYKSPDNWEGIRKMVKIKEDVDLDKERQDYVRWIKIGLPEARKGDPKIPHPSFPEWLVEHELAEKKMHKYIYSSHQDKGAIFECDAYDIMEADELYKKATGQDPKKQNDVYCEIKNIENEE